MSSSRIFESGQCGFSDLPPQCSQKIVGSEIIVPLTYPVHERRTGLLRGECDAERRVNIVL